jgi:hypothetical protein
VAVVLAIVGVSPVPGWALGLVVADISLWGSALTYVFTVERHGTSEKATIRQQRSRIVALALGNGLLGTLALGVWLYNAWPSPAFVNVIPTKRVVLSPEAGAPPRDSYDALVLPGGEEESAYCYVRISNSTWLKFRDGWAPASAFHYPAGFAQQLPRPCG